MTVEATSAQTSELMTDHPGWVIWPEEGYAQRAFRSGDTVWMVSCYRAEESFRPAIEVVHQTIPADDDRLVVDTFDVAALPPHVRRALLPGGTARVHRVRNPDVWDALLWPIFRHRIATTIAADRYRAFCARYGTVVTTKLGNALLPPRPEIAATLDDDAEITGRRMPVIRALAREYLQLNPDGACLPPSALYDAMRRLPRIGEWSAARIVADTTGDFSFHTRPDFGVHKQQQQHAADPGATDQVPDPKALWTSCDYQQRSTIVALATHHQLNAPGKRESTDRNTLMSLLRGAARQSPVRAGTGQSARAVTY